MSQAIKNILQAIEDLEDSPLGRSYDLRVDLAGILLRNLKEKGWTQRDLARAAKMKEPQVSRILHSNVNWTVDTIARLLFALKIRARLEQVDNEIIDLRNYETETPTLIVTVTITPPAEEYVDGQENGEKACWQADAITKSSGWAEGGDRETTGRVRPVSGRALV